jgi:RNA polymerase sigma factor (sigma-70 family)
MAEVVDSTVVQDKANQSQFAKRIGREFAYAHPGQDQSPRWELLAWGALTHDGNRGRRIESEGFRVNAGRDRALYRGRDLRRHAAGCPVRAGGSRPAQAGRPRGNVFWQGRTTVSEQSFENLVNEHGRQVLRTALRVLRDENLAHDVHQEVFLAIWRRWDRYNGDVNWPAYLYRATVRKALELAERRMNGPGCDPPPRRPVAAEPDSALQADELQQKLAAALARLPRRQADAFVLSRLEGLATVEVAGIMGCSEPTVRVHLHRALLRLARALHEFLGQ